jgi:hypothetical protein
MKIITLIGFLVLIEGTELEYERIRFETWAPDDEELVRFLKIATDPSRTPVLVHCLHGSDRTGAMCALYRIILQGNEKRRLRASQDLGESGEVDSRAGCQSAGGCAENVITGNRGRVCVSPPIILTARTRPCTGPHSKGGYSQRRYAYRSVACRIFCLSKAGPNISSWVSGPMDQ